MIHRHSPTGPKIRHGISERVHELAKTYNAQMRDMIQSYVQVGGIAELRATLQDGQIIKHQFSVPKGLYHHQVDAYIAVEADELNRRIEQATRKQ